MQTHYKPILYTSAKIIRLDYSQEKAPNLKEWMKNYNPQIDSITASTMKGLLGIDSIEATGMDGIHKVKVIFKDIDNIEYYHKNGEYSFLHKLNLQEFNKISINIFKLKNQIDKIEKNNNSVSEYKINLLNEQIEDYDELRKGFIDWFISNNFEIPQFNSSSILTDHSQTYKSKINIESPMRYIRDYDTIIIETKRGKDYRLKNTFRLSGKSHESRAIKITSNNVSFLYFLAYERQKKGQYWLLEPNKYIEIIKRLPNLFDMSPKFEGEILKKPEKPKTWIWDNRNKNRRSIVNKIHTSLKDIENIHGQLIQSLEVDSYHRGIYILAPTIKRVILPNI